MISRPSAKPALGALLGPVLLVPALLCAQAADGRLIVSVHGAESGEPLPGVIVVVGNGATEGVTDRRGMVSLARLSPGAHPVELRHLGYRSQTAVAELIAGAVTRLDFTLEIDPIPLDELRVRSRSSVLTRNGFYRRKGHGGGRFITREEIERMRPRYMSDVLRKVSGMSFASSAFGGATNARIRGAKVVSGSCPIQYYVDGTMTYRLNIDDIPPETVEGIEIYRGAATIPADFNKGSAMCGVIVVWMRDR